MDIYCEKCFFCFVVLRRYLLDICKTTTKNISALSALLRKTAHSLSAELTYSGLPSRRLRSRLYSAHLCAAVTFESVSTRCAQSVQSEHMFEIFAFHSFQTPAISSPAFSTPAVWCRVIHSRDFHSRVFSVPK